MPIWNNYYTARSVEDALQAMAVAPGVCRTIAGGTDLLLDLQQGRLSPVDTLVDVTAIPEMTCLEMRTNSLFIGAAVSLSEIASSPLVKQHARALADACDLIGGPQVRNVATLGGNVAHALPAADGTIALLALDAVVEIGAYPGGRRSVPLGQLFTGPGQSILDPQHELLVGFHLPALKNGQASAFARVMRPQGVALPVLNMAVWLERKDDSIQDVRIAVGPAGPVPRRGLASEKILRGQAMTEAVEGLALKALLAEVTLRTSPHRATAGYRRHLTGILLHEVLQQAWRRAGA
jgi:xanthine dehydrogenase FAD-binding subunit